MLFEPPKGTKLRHEWKHIISPSDQTQLIARLSTFCSPDPHYGAQSYHIRSLYFDNVYGKALQERLNGQECREKFRIRHYNFDDSYIVLEKKSKFNQLCGKNSARLTRTEVETLLRGDIDWLIQKESSLCHELYAKMRGQLLKPKVIVDYLPHNLGSFFADLTVLFVFLGNKFTHQASQASVHIVKSLD